MSSHDDSIEASARPEENAAVSLLGKSIHASGRIYDQTVTYRSTLVDLSENNAAASYLALAEFALEFNRVTGRNFTTASIIEDVAIKPFTENIFEISFVTSTSRSGREFHPSDYETITCYSNEDCKAYALANEALLLAFENVLKKAAFS